MLQAKDGPNRKVGRSRKRSSGCELDTVGKNDLRSSKLYKPDQLNTDDMMKLSAASNTRHSGKSKQIPEKTTYDDSVWFANSFIKERKILTGADSLSNINSYTTSMESSSYFCQNNKQGNVMKLNATDHPCVVERDPKNFEKHRENGKTSTSRKNKVKTDKDVLSGDSILDNSDMWLADLDIHDEQNIKSFDSADSTRPSHQDSKVHHQSDLPKKAKNDKINHAGLNRKLQNNFEITGKKNEVDQVVSDMFESSFSEEDFLEQINTNSADCKTDKNFQNLNSETTGDNRSRLKDNQEEVKTNNHFQNSETIDDSRSRLNDKKVIAHKKDARMDIQGQSLCSLQSNEFNNRTRLDVSDKPQNVVAKTPAGSGSLRDRIKKRLQENVGAASPKTPGSMLQEMREDIIQRAQDDAEQLGNQYTNVDIGPFYGLPTKVQQLLECQRGIKKFYDWQDECLKLPAVLNGKNLIYSLPTSGGKTLVAEILILRELLCKKKDALLILPFVSIVQEKVRNMSHFAVDLDFLVEEYAGSKGKFPPIKRRKKKSLFIATIEKAHSLVNSLIEQARLDSLGLVVVDELHMLGEGGSRGATLESSLLKIIHSQNDIQIIGMSATLNNIENLQQFIKAEVYSNDFRPVTLTEYVKLQDNIFEVQPKAKCPDDLLQHERVVTFQYTSDMNKVDCDHLFGLVMEVIPNNSCLLFCPTKKNCENVALMLSKLIVKHKKELSDVKKSERKALLKELYTDGDKRICPVLQYTIHFGVAYHHSGLTTDERKLIEEAYSDGILCLLTCTSTLAAGVNLPAKRVILRCPYVGSQFISRSQYKQMVGRAGRAGIDTSGESILITKISDTEKVGELLSGPVESCHSSLMYNGGKGIRNLLLSAIGLQITPTTTDVFSFMNKTLLSVQSGQSSSKQSSQGSSMKSDQKSLDVVEITKGSLQSLINLGLVVQKKIVTEDSTTTVHLLEVSPLGKATFKGSVDIDCANQLYKDLKKAEESLFLSSHLHLLFLVTPYDMASTIKPSWTTYFQQMNTLSPIELGVAGVIGVPESYITKKASGQVSKQVVDDLVVSRFYLTLMLYDLWKQKSIWEVSETFQQPRGFIQNLLSSAASFASCVHHFCQELEEFWAYQDLLGNFVKRLSYCVTAELIPLMEIPGVKLGRAKQLYSAGYKSLSLVAHADPENIVKSVKQIPRRVATQIVASAKILLNEKAEALWEEVEDLVTVPVDMPEVKTPAISSQGSETYSLNSSPFDSQIT